MWEYKTVFVPRKGKTFNVMAVAIDADYDRWMDSLGQQGWALVSATPRTFGGVHQGDTLYFKRQKATEPPHEVRPAAFS